MPTYENLEGKSRPYSCNVCRKTPKAFYGRLLLPGEEIPSCPNHKKRIAEGTLDPSLIVLVPSGR